MLNFPNTEDAAPLLRPEQADTYLQSAGFPVAKATLAKLRCVGSGPKFRRFGRLIVYAPVDLRAWASEKVGGPVSTTSQY